MFVLKVWRCPDWEYTVKEKKNELQCKRLHWSIYIGDEVSELWPAENTDPLNERNDHPGIIRFSDFYCCALFTKYSINNIYRNYMKYKKRKEIKQYIARKKMCSVTIKKILI